MKKKRIFKFGTGEAIPEDAKYLNTVRQTRRYNGQRGVWEDCWFVWHYFLVEVDELPQPSKKES